MTERQLTFIDVDENSLVLWLKEDRVQLRVVDSRPELEAGELRAFASVLFAEYVGGPLVKRLEGVREQLGGVRDRLAADGANDLIPALDVSLRAVAEIGAAIAGVRAAIAPAPPPAPPAEHAPAQRSAISAPRSPRRPRRTKKADQARDGDLPRWGW